ncbi:MAG: IS66 family insertion sequence element accessory protein TnpB [Akkermansia sp.]
MFNHPNLIIKFYKQPADLRFGIYRLQGYISQNTHPSILKEGSLFLFMNKNKSLLKILWFDGTGFCLFSKRLESGTFCHPKPAIESPSLWLNLSPSALQLLLDGIDLKQGAKRAWYEV